MRKAALPLKTSNLSRLAGRVDVPTYDRGALTPSVVHISVGNFHRSHQAVYFDDLARTGERGWGIVGVGYRRRELDDALRRQDNLYTVVERGATEDRARIAGAMGRYLFAPRDRRAVLAALADERTRLVTMTITGAGYQIDHETGRFTVDDPDVAADLAGRAGPQSALGQIVAALDARRRARRAPFTVLSCDNLATSGVVARNAIVAFAGRRDAGLARWIERNVAFPGSLVDRITPTTTEHDRAFVAGAFGVDDRWPVTTETFSQWIVEDSFCNARPPLDAVGVQFVTDVRPHAQIKTRLLNATHCALGHLGLVAGLATTTEAVADPVLGDYARRLMGDEVRPLLPRIPGLDLGAYEQTLFQRIANPRMADQLCRLGRSGSTKLPRHIVPSIVGARARGSSHALLTLAVAGWCRYLRGVDERGSRFAVDDPAAARLQRLLAEGDSRALLRERSIFGALGDDPAFAAELSGAVEAIDRLGVRGAIAATTSPGRLAA